MTAFQVTNIMYTTLYNIWAMLVLWELKIIHCVIEYNNSSTVPCMNFQRPKHENTVYDPFSSSFPQAGKTALITASEKGHSDVVTALIKGHADVNIWDEVNKYLACSSCDEVLYTDIQSQQIQTVISGHCYNHIPRLHSLNGRVRPWDEDKWTM